MILCLYIVFHVALFIKVGRTARAGGKGRALLFLLPQELGFLKYLKHAKIPLNEYEFPQHKIAQVQQQVTTLANCKASQFSYYSILKLLMIAINLLLLTGNGWKEQTFLKTIVQPILNIKT